MASDLPVFPETVSRTCAVLSAPREYQCQSLFQFLRTLYHGFFHRARHKIRLRRTAEMYPIRRGPAAQNIRIKSRPVQAAAFYRSRGSVTIPSASSLACAVRIWQSIFSSRSVAVFIRCNQVYASIKTMACSFSVILYPPFRLLIQQAIPL